MTEDQRQYVGHVGMMQAAREQGWHPEILLDIPQRVITAKPAHKRATAQQLGYDGPVTLAEAVEMGVITPGQARYLVNAWAERQFNRQATEEELATWLGRSERVERGAA